MSSTRFDTFDHAARTAHAWLGEVSRTFGTDDRHFAYRALRAWLHTLRDRMTVDTAAGFAAQLPELLRGVFYDGWQPAKTPIKYGPDEYRLRFAHEAGIPIADVAHTTGLVTSALRARLAPGQLEQALALLPRHIRIIVEGPAPTAAQPEAPTPNEPAEPAEERFQRLEAQVNTLTEALGILAHGLEQVPYDEPDSQRASQAAHRAHDLLLTTATTATTTSGTPLGRPTPQPS
jgi:uncharacterized protein (DUF2267 family)